MTTMGLDWALASRKWRQSDKRASEGKLVAL